MIEIPSLKDIGRSKLRQCFKYAGYILSEKSMKRKDELMYEFEDYLREVFKSLLPENTDIHFTFLVGRKVCFGLPDIDLWSNELISQLEEHFDITYACIDDVVEYEVMGVFYEKQFFINDINEGDKE